MLQETGRNHRRHHAGNRLAAPLGPRLFAGVVRNKLGLTLVSEKTGEERVYRIVAKQCLAEAQSQAGLARRRDRHASPSV